MNFRGRQLEICTELIRNFHQQVFNHNLILDKELQKVLRSNRQWGSKDRRLYSNTVFSFFRWYGALVKKFGPIKNWESQTWIDATLLSSELGDESVADKDAQTILDITIDPVVDLLPEAIANTFYDKMKLEIFAQAQQIRPPAWIRVKDRKTVTEVLAELRKENIDCHVHPKLKTAISITGKFNINGLSSFRKGKCTIQDFASQCIGEVAKPTSGERWLDVCAGSGGKTLQLAQLMSGEGQIVATDLRSEILNELNRRTKQYRDIITTKAHNYISEPFELGNFDGVLVDAPCTNSGTWRRNPALRWQFSEKSVRKVTEKQLKILTSAAQSVKSGGVLIYSTCSATYAENFGVVKEFLAQNKGFELESFPNPVTGKNCKGGLVLRHDLADNDTMFVARLRKSL